MELLGIVVVHPDGGVASRVVLRGRVTGGDGRGDEDGADGRGCKQMCVRV